MDGVYIAKAAAYLGAALVMGIGSVGPALGQGSVGAEACRNFSKYPEQGNKLRTLMFLAMGLIETVAIYCLLVAFVLLYLGWSL